MLDKRYQPGIVPNLASDTDTRNFDAEFTDETPADSVAPSDLETAKKKGKKKGKAAAAEEGHEFDGFNFTADAMEAVLDQGLDDVDALTADEEDATLDSESKGSDANIEL